MLHTATTAPFSAIYEAVGHTRMVSQNRNPYNSFPTAKVGHMSARNLWIPFFRNMADMPNRPSAKRLQASTSLCKTPDSLWKPFFEPLRVSLSPFHSYVRSLYSGKKSHRRPEWGQNEARRPECCQKAASPASIMGKKPTKAGKYKKIIKKHSKLSWKKATRKYT